MRKATIFVFFFCLGGIISSAFADKAALIDTAIHSTTSPSVLHTGWHDWCTAHPQKCHEEWCERHPEECHEASCERHPLKCHRQWCEDHPHVCAQEWCENHPRECRR